MPINFYTPTFRQQVNPIDLNVLARTYNTTSLDNASFTTSPILSTVDE